MTFSNFLKFPFLMPLSKAVLLNDSVVVRLSQQKNTVCRKRHVNLSVQKRRQKHCFISAPCRSHESKGALWPMVFALLALESGPKTLAHLNFLFGLALV